MEFSCPNETCRLGVISDTHGLLRTETVELLQEVDFIIHAGDIGSFELLDTLKTIAPVAAVRGNTDGGHLGLILPETESIRIGDVLIFVLHDLNRLLFNPADEGVHLVISGHTHQPLIQSVQGVTYLNPGSAGPRRFTLPISMAIVELHNGQSSFHHIDLEKYRLKGN